MKTIGLLGGMSWQSSKFYYEYLNQLVAEQLGDPHSAKILMSSVDFSEVAQHFGSENWDAIGKLMAQEAQRLEHAGADIIVLGTNTIHLVSAYIQQSISIPFLHIASATGQEIRAKQIKRVALLGTRFTMEKDFYTKILQEDFDLEVLIPSLSDRNYLQQLIFNELVKGVFTPVAKQRCLDIIADLAGKGAEGAILGCTELPLLISSEEAIIPTFDTTFIHSKAAVTFSLDTALNEA
ncbi:MAG: amino acid racemase [Bacteroidota bacterium]